MNSAVPLNQLKILNATEAENTVNQSEDTARQAIASADTASASEFSQTALAAAGLKPIVRLSSDDRMNNVIPHSHATYNIRYCSLFAREFVRGSYNFCAVKMTVARGGKLRALDQGFKDAEEWVNNTLDWLNTRAARGFPMRYGAIAVDIPHPLAGRLIRLLTEYDRIVEKSMASMVARQIDSNARDGILSNAEKRVSRIHQLCIPDNDRFDFDGSLLEE